MRIDSHIHFIDYSKTEYPWIGKGMEVLETTFLPNNLKPLIDSIEFDGVVAVQARQSLEETEWLLALSEEYDLIKGVVGWVDLCSSKVEEQLKKYVKSPKFKGVRHVIHDEVDDDFMLRKDFGRGISALKHYDLTYDLLIFEKHLPQTIQLVKQHPEQSFVIDHIAKPRMKERKIKDWYEYMKILSSFDNIYCKISGMVTEVEWENGNLEDFIPYLDKLFKLFDPSRLMIGSDWPVCTLAKDYQDVMKIVFDYIGHLPNEDQAKVLGITCSDFYKLS